MTCEEGWGTHDKTNLLKIKRFTPDEFFTLKKDWASLLQRSDADPLFLSWEWMYNWWHVYGGGARDELLLLGVYDDAQLVCLAPLYINTTTIKRCITTRRVEFLGTRSSGASGFRTEYLQFICDKDATEQPIEMALSHVEDEVPFDVIRLADLVTSSPTYTVVQRLANEAGYYTRDPDVSQTYGIPCGGRFAEYLDNLGKNSRLQLYNRRKLLAKLGKVTCTRVDHTNFEQTLDELSDFHQDRWQAHISYASHKLFVKRLIDSNAVEVSGVKVFLDTAMIGCTFDLLCGDRCYNFQSGFLDNVDKKISTGTLVFGYAIESCFSDPRLKYYDLMAGEGKNSDYKARLASPGSRFESIEVIGSPVLRYVYSLKDRVTHVLSRRTSRVTRPETKRITRRDSAASVGIGSSQRK